MELELSLPDSIDPPDDEALVQAALAGDTEAFGHLVERYAPRMFRMIRVQVTDTFVAEDLVQEAFLRAFVALPKFQSRASFYTWLYRIMTNAVAHHQRQSARRRDLDAQAHRDAELELPADAEAETREAREGVRRALADLPEAYRTALLLREWEGKSYAEIAETLACPLGTVASRIARAREMLAERLGPG